MVGSNKGGTGKTTTASNLAVALSLNNKDVCLVDADFQRSASKWHADRLSAKLQPMMTLVEKYDNIASMLESLNKKFDYIVVDVAGRNSREMITGLSVSDILIAPHQASQLDLDTIQELQEQIIKVKDLNPTLKCFVLHSLASTNPILQNKEKNDFSDYLSDFSDIKLCNTKCYYRKAYRDAIPLGQSVVEMSNKMAKQEILALTNEILSQ